MKNLFYTGGPLFMGILTVLFILMAAWFIYRIALLYTSSQPDKEKTLRYMSYGRSIGLFAMIVGILGQLVGLYEAFSAIEQAEDISPALVFGGIKVSMITTLYGILIFLISIVLWLVGSFLSERKK